MIISIIFILTAIISSIIVGFDLVKNRQPMKIMNAVWILTALWGSVLGLAAYFWFGQERSATRGGGYEDAKYASR